MSGHIGIHPIDDDLLRTMEMFAGWIELIEYPRILRAKGVDYVVGGPVRGAELLTGHCVINSYADYGYPIICKLTDIWAD